MRSGFLLNQVRLMSNSRFHPWLHRFALFTALVTLALIALGGLVTSHGVGMAVPDWPNTYGYNMFLFPVSQWIGGILYEHTHRLAAAFVGLLTTILALWLWVRETRGRARWAGAAVVVAVLVLMGVRQLPVYIALAALAPLVVAIGLYQIQGHPGSLRWWGVIAFAAVVLQGVLGGLRVVLFKDQIGIFHATLAQLFFVLICAISLLTSRWWQDRGSRVEGQGSSQPAVSQGFQPAEPGFLLDNSKRRNPADWKSAIRQVGNLRYVLAS